MSLAATALSNSAEQATSRALAEVRGYPEISALARDRVRHAVERS